LKGTTAEFRFSVNFMDTDVFTLTSRPTEECYIIYLIAYLVRIVMTGYVRGTISKTDRRRKVRRFDMFHALREITRLIPSALYAFSRGSEIIDSILSKIASYEKRKSDFLFCISTIEIER